MCLAIVGLTHLIEYMRPYGDYYHHFLIPFAPHANPRSQPIAPSEVARYSRIRAYCYAHRSMLFPSLWLEEGPMRFSH